MRLMPNFPAVLEYRAASFSLRGRQRAANGDVVHHRFRTLPGGQTAGFAVICDGLGEFDTGSFASRMAVRSIRKVFSGPLNPLATGFAPSQLELRRLIAGALRQANGEIYSLGRTKFERPIPHPGTALTLAVLLGDQATIAHIGNSRAYLYREHVLSRLTVDHSIVSELISGGVLPSTKARRHPQRNVLTRALGTQPEVKADFRITELMEGDRLLLCSNGLWSSFPRDSKLASYLQSDSSSRRIAENMVRAARKLDGADDLSAIVIEVNQPI